MFSTRGNIDKRIQSHLQRILPRETLIAVSARKRLHSEMDPLMPLQIVIAVEALRALVALEGPIVDGHLLLGAVHGGGLAAVGRIARLHHPRGHGQAGHTRHDHRVVWVVHVRHHGPQGSGQGSGRGTGAHGR